MSNNEFNISVEALKRHHQSNQQSNGLPNDILSVLEGPIEEYNQLMTKSNADIYSHISTAIKDLETFIEEENKKYQFTKNPLNIFIHIYQDILKFFEKNNVDFSKKDLPDDQDIQKNKDLINNSMEGSKHHLIAKLILIDLYEQQKILGEQFLLQFSVHNADFDLALTNEHLSIKTYKDGKPMLLEYNIEESSFKQNNVAKDDRFVENFCTYYYEFMEKYANSNSSQAFQLSKKKTMGDG